MPRRRRPDRDTSSENSQDFSTTSDYSTTGARRNHLHRFSTAELAAARFLDANLEMDFLRERNEARRRTRNQEIEDRRTTHGHRTRQPYTLTHRFPEPAWSNLRQLMFKSKFPLMICTRRKARREVLFALAGGKGKIRIKKHRRKRNQYSSIGCK